MSEKKSKKLKQKPNNLQHILSNERNKESGEKLVIPSNLKNLEPVNFQRGNNQIVVHHIYHLNIG